MEPPQQALSATTALNLPSMYLKESNAKRPSISAEIATDGFFHRRVGLSQRPNQENYSPFA
jgi:hypothetical protein